MEKKGKKWIRIFLVWKYSNKTKYAILNIENRKW